MKKDMLVEIATFAYILLFSYAATSKLFNMKLFYLQMKLQPFNASLIPYIIWGVPILELLIVVTLVMPRYKLIGLKLATGLMVVFTGYITLAKIGYFKNVPCSCGGVISKMTWGQHLWFNLFFLLLGMVALVINYRKRQLNFN